MLPQTFVDENGVPTPILISRNNAGRVSIPITTVSGASVYDGSKTVTVSGTRETLTATSTPFLSAAITAKQSNTGTVLVGGTTVTALSGSTRRGTPLNSGDTIVFNRLTDGVSDLAQIYVDTTVNGEGVTYTYTQ